MVLLVGDDWVEEPAVIARFERTRTLRSCCPSPTRNRSSGARVLAEFGDDPHRYTTAKGRKNFAGTSPITRQSGKKTVIAHYVHDDRFIDALAAQAFSTLSNSPGARAYHDTLRTRATGHRAALRQLANRLVGIRHGCLKTHTAPTKRPPGRAPLRTPLDISGSWDVFRGGWCDQLPTRHRSASGDSLMPRMTIVSTHADSSFEVPMTHLPAVPTISMTHWITRR